MAYACVCHFFLQIFVVTSVLPTKMSMVPPNLRSHSRANNNDFPLKI